MHRQNSHTINSTVLRCTLVQHKGTVTYGKPPPGLSSYNIIIISWGTGNPAFTGVYDVPKPYGDKKAYVKFYKNRSTWLCT